MVQDFLHQQYYQYLPIITADNSSESNFGDKNNSNDHPLRSWDQFFFGVGVGFSVLGSGAFRA